MDAVKTFPYEDCLFKQFVRTRGWLPLCRERLESVRQGPRKQAQRRLRYFTFCAIGAVDVLMLDVAKVLSRSSTDRFDTVVFFDQSPEAVDETLKRIPGATGFNGDFVDLVLRKDPDEDAAPRSSLDEKTPLLNTAKTRNELRLLSQRRDFIRQFPFDVINLDLEEFIFKAKDPFPGRVVNALRRVFEWQHRELTGPHIAPHSLAGFSLMFTTQVGPHNLPDSYLRMLRGKLNSNIHSNKNLRQLLEERSKIREVKLLQQRDFKLFFELGLPKVLTSILHEQDWFVDPAAGVTTFEFERPSKTGPYTMLHLVMQVKRQHPPLELRAPGDHETAEARQAYRQVAQRIFEQPTTTVSRQTIDPAELKGSLELIRARRRKYYGADPSGRLYCPCGCFG